MKKVNKKNIVGGILNVMSRNENVTQYRTQTGKNLIVTKNSTQNSTKNVPKMNIRNNKKFTSSDICLIKDPKILRNNIEFPSFEYEGGDGFKTVNFTLKKDEKIRANGGVMNYMSSRIKIETTIGNSYSDAFIRTMSGSTAFYNIFYNDTEKPSDITLSGVNPGNLGCFFIPKGKRFNMASDTYICCTTNLTVSTNFKVGGLFTGYGLTYVDIEAKDSDGLVWGASFGDVIEKVIEPGNGIKIDNGVLLGFESNINFYTNTVGSSIISKSSVFSGEGLVSVIENNGNSDIKIFLQSRSKSTYIDYINTIVKPEKPLIKFKSNSQPTSQLSNQSNNQSNNQYSWGFFGSGKKMTDKKSKKKIIKK